MLITCFASLTFLQIFTGGLRLSDSAKGIISPSDVAELRELVGNRLVEVGFTDDDELTPEGARLEQLIDVLAPW